MALTRNQMKTQLRTRGAVRLTADYDSERAFNLVSYDAEENQSVEIVGDDTLWPIIISVDLYPESGGRIDWNLTADKIEVRPNGRFFGHDQLWVV